MTTSSLRLIVLAAALPLGAAVAAEAIEGRVFERRDGREVGVRKVLVHVSAPSGGVVATVKTDERGRFRLVGPFSSRVRLGVRRAGWFVVSAAGSPDSFIAADCAAPCGPFEFEIARGAVVSGVAVDDLDEPMENIAVTVQGEGPENRWTAQTRTDDRGRFRVAGVSPGAYVLRAEVPNRMGRGFAYGHAEQTVDLAAGEERDVRLRLQPSNAGLYRVSGTVSGAAIDPSTRGALGLRDAGPGAGRFGRSLMTMVAEDGAFAFDRVPEGRYHASFHQRGGRGSSPRSLGFLDVHSDLTGLALSPPPATRLAGRVEFDSDDPPANVELRLRAEDDPFAWARLTAALPDYAFEGEDLTPAIYRVEVGGRDWWVRSVRVGDRATEGAEIDLTDGSLDNIVVALGNEFAVVRGAVRSAGGDRSVGAHYTVALKGSRGVRSTQTDQFGRFEFERVVPGDYRIGAWSNASVGEARDDDLWNAAGDAARSFPAEPGGEIEVILTAVQ